MKFNRVLAYETVTLKYIIHTLVRVKGYFEDGMLAVS